MKLQALSKKPYFPLALFNVLLFLFLAVCAAYFSLALRYPAVFACAFAQRAHLYCPGCGGSRALFALLRLDILGSLACNPAVLFGGATVAYYEIALVGYARGRRVSAVPAIAYAALILLFFLVRNILLVVAGIDPLGDLIAYWR